MSCQFVRGGACMPIPASWVGHPGLRPSPRFWRQDMAEANSGSSASFGVLCRRGLQRGIYPRHLGCHMRPTPLSTPGNTPPTAALSIAVSVHPGTTASFLEDLSLCDVRHVLVRKPLVRLRECSHWPLLQPPHLQWLLHSLPSQAPPHELVGGFNPCEQILAKLEIFPKQGCKY